MTRYGEVKQRPHFYHHGDTICQASRVIEQPNCMHVAGYCLNVSFKYPFYPGIRRELTVLNFVNIMQTNDPETIGNLAKFMHGLKLYT